MAQQTVLTVADVAKAQIVAFNEKNWEKVRAGLAPGFVYEEVATGRRAEGINDTLTLWRTWVTAMPDLTGRIANEYVSDTTVVLELVWSGTHTGPLQTLNGEIAPTGKRLTLRACEVLETAGDAVTAARHYFDMAELLRQVGTLPK